MIVYRISQTRYAGDLSGIGAKRFGGRWNRKGRAVAYASSSRALATLELLVNFKSPTEQLPFFAFTVIEVDDTQIYTVDRGLLQPFSPSTNYEQCQSIAEDAWTRLDALGIIVPSVVLPYEDNIILNPVHPQFGDMVSVLRVEPFSVDGRLT